MKLVNVVLFIWLLLWSFDGTCQYIPHHTDNEDVYNFLSELRIKGIVEYNPAVLPLSRKEIADLIWQADTSEGLNPIQRKEVQFWKQEFGKDIGNGKVYRTGKFFKRRTFEGLDVKKRLDLFYFANDLFQVTVNPIVSGVGMVSAGKELQRIQYWGGEIYGRIGKGLGYYFSIRDYLEQPAWNGQPILSPELGGVFRNSSLAKGGIEYYEVRGGITYGWKWGEVGIVKDHLELGSSQQNQIILSNRAPSIPRFHMKLKPIKWAELTYTFGWLSSGLVDSTRSYMTGNGVYREVYHSKYLVANLITVRPWKYIVLSVGSSVIVADNNFNAGHFIPIMFYNALDHGFNGQTNNAGQNSQVYADLSFDLFGWGRIYGSILIDEIRLSTMFDKEKQRNAIAYQVGIQSRPFTRWNLKFYSRYTRVRPSVYKHYIPQTTYETAGYTLGHFLGENSDAWLAGMQLRPLPKFRIIFEYQRWRKGPDHVFDALTANLSGAQFMTRAISVSDRFSMRFRYQIINGIGVQLAVYHIQGNSNGIHPFPGVNEPNTSNTWFSFGLNIGY